MIKPVEELVAFLGDGEVHGMEDSEAEGVEDSVDEEVTAPVDVEAIWTGDFMESIPEETEEAFKPRMMSIPPAPSRQEVLVHRITHCPFRAWCPECAQSKSHSTQHRSSGDTSEVEHVPVVAFDYFCMLTNAKDRGRRRR